MVAKTAATALTIGCRFGGGVFSPCLFDAEGPCANAVKDAQRTKTSPETRRTLSILWGPADFAEEVDGACRWYRELLERAGAETQGVD